MRITYQRLVFAAALCITGINLFGQYVSGGQIGFAATCFAIVAVSSFAAEWSNIKHHHHLHETDAAEDALRRHFPTGLERKED